MSLACSVAEIGGLVCTGFIPAQTLVLVLNVPEYSVPKFGVKYQRIAVRERIIELSY